MMSRFSNILKCGVLGLGANVLLEGTVLVRLSMCADPVWEVVWMRKV